MSNSIVNDDHYEYIDVAARIKAGAYVLAEPLKKGATPEERKAHYTEMTRRRDAFRDDLARTNGVRLDHPKLGALFDLASDRGSGLLDVMEQFNEMAVLLSNV